MIGLSLSFCIVDILAGKVLESEVQKIITGTAVASEAEWQNLIKTYREIYWWEDPDKGEAILRRFIAAGKLEQPRLEGKEARNIARGHWLK